MKDRTKVQHWMPLMREFGGLQRKRFGEGVTPLEYQRCLDLKRQIGRKFAGEPADGHLVRERRTSKAAPTRLVVSYENRDMLIDSIIDNIQPAGFFVPTPFAAAVGTRFLVRISLLFEGETADIPGVVVTSMTQGAQTLATMAMGMAVKIEKTNSTQAAGLSKIFDRTLNGRLGLVG